MLVIQVIFCFIVNSDRPNLETLDALDLWLDNALMDCSRSLVSHQKDWKITKTQWVDTFDLPNIGKFDPTNYMEHGEKLLSFIQKSVKAGSSYWLYRGTYYMIKY